MGLFVIKFPISFTWTCFKNKTIYHVKHLHYDDTDTLTMTLESDVQLVLEYGTPAWIEFALLIHSHNFQTPRSHCLRGMVYFIQLKSTLRTRYEKQLSPI